MLSVDPDAVHEFVFLKYLDIIPFHRLAPYYGSEDLAIGQQFPNKEACEAVIEKYSIEVSWATKLLCLNWHCISGSVRGVWKGATGEYELY
ncbi:hypothetical protein J1N35_019070 [Gossypium stocksii]|uniref:Uncharacterized protein n=1 Tax=Gossypium stocksii TaxID=47602 RepID=A0A9D3VRX0_9ROSI|nr:hypothetical protein J1N35_019070 [Gossypium stocksii]